DLVHALWLQRLPWRQRRRRERIRQYGARSRARRSIRQPGDADRRQHRHCRRPLHPRLHPLARKAAGGQLSAADALLRRPDQRRRSSENHCLHQVPDAGKAAMSEVAIETPGAAASYLADGFTLRSWLLTTDHKRIAILYFG